MHASHSTNCQARCLTLKIVLIPLGILIALIDSKPAQVWSEVARLFKSMVLLHEVSHVISLSLMIEVMSEDLRSVWPLGRSSVPVFECDSVRCLSV